MRFSLKSWITHFLCDHEWKQSRFVNIATGENLGSRCTKCGKYKS